ncbi:SIMPL domain-containing protein [Paenibacillus aceris]|uniref:Uncharacterized protein YggE n=1 Tax=Paenibacillus aceris TaxID=869555 RepID=A0ABS4I018_9BACL|nr:SIMPL domain-containing protein [Paenibacillus aceris]MBP1964258.1 uncharacterized protein YggE [Paenibacillus aceris]NHW36581.1 SIMPL domain-containing protein [Paenibacillus aceris]
MYSYPLYKTASPFYSQCIEVLGEGTVTAAPDRAVVVLGVITDGPNLHVIQTENAKTVSNIIQSLLDLRIPREKIQTYDYRIEVIYDYHDGKQIFRGYKVTHLLKITTDNVEQTGNIVDTAVSNGANEVTSIRFTTAHPETYVNQALSLAIQNGRQKALTIANTLGVTLSPVPFRVQEQSSTAAIPAPYMASKLAISEAATPIQPGQLVFDAKARVWYLFN